MKFKVYRSRINVFILGFFLAIFVILVLIIVLLFQHKFYGIACVLCGVLAIFIFILFGFRYIISGDVLYLKAWFISVGNVRIGDIISVERTYFTTPYPAATMIYPVAPAASIVFLCIRFRYDISSRNKLSKWHKPDFWLISPVREREFIEDLLAVNPKIYNYIFQGKKRIWRFWEWDI